MATISIHADTSKLQRYLATRPFELRNAIHRIIESAVKLVERESKIKTPVDTGRLRASIGGGVFQGGSFPEGTGVQIQELRATIGPSVNYARFVHRRRPFMVEGVTAAVPSIKKVIQLEVRKALEK